MKSLFGWVKFGGPKKLGNFPLLVFSPWSFRCVRNDQPKELKNAGHCDL